MIINLQKGFNTVRKQGHLGSCTAFAASAIVEYVRNRIEGRYDCGTDYLSPRYLYYYNRHTVYHVSGSRYRTCPVHPTRPKDVAEGSTGTDTSQALRDMGICEEKDWEYAGCEARPAFPGYDAPGYTKHCDNKFADTPSPDCNDRAIRLFKQYVKSIEEIGSTSDKWFRELRDGNPIFFSISTDSAFAAAKGDFFHQPGGMGYEHGHAVVILGYDPAYKAPDGNKYPAFLLRNSWGKRWGNKGHIWISRDTLMNSLLGGQYVFRPAKSFTPFPKPGPAPQPANPPKPGPGPKPVPPTPPPPTPPTPTPSSGEFMYQWWFFEHMDAAIYCLTRNLSPNTLQSNGWGRKLDGPAHGLGQYTNGKNLPRPRPGDSGNFISADPHISAASSSNGVVSLGACRINDLPADMRSSPERADGFWKWVVVPINKIHPKPVPKP